MLHILCTAHSNVVCHCIQCSDTCNDEEISCFGGAWQPFTQHSPRARSSEDLTHFWICCIVVDVVLLGKWNFPVNNCSLQGETKVWHWPEWLAVTAGVSESECDCTIVWVVDCDCGGV